MSLVVIDVCNGRSLQDSAEHLNSSSQSSSSSSSISSKGKDSGTNDTWIQESGLSLPKPYVMSENTLSGKSDVVGIDRILFPASFSSLPQPLRNIVNTIVRIPVIVAGLIVGENAELIGLQAMQIGNALLMMGSNKFGQSSHLFLCHSFCNSM